MPNQNEIEDLSALKRVVKTMGVLLVVGTIALVVAVAFKASKSKNKNSIQQIEEISNNECEYKNIEANVGDNIINAHKSGNYLTIVRDDKVVVVNLCSGKFVIIK